jgi:hypothetical protein
LQAAAEAAATGGAAPDGKGKSRRDSYHDSADKLDLSSRQFDAEQYVLRLLGEKSME